MVHSKDHLSSSTASTTMPPFPCKSISYNKTRSHFSNLCTSSAVVCRISLSFSDRRIRRAIVAMIWSQVCLISSLSRSSWQPFLTWSAHLLFKSLKGWLFICISKCLEGWPDRKKVYTMAIMAIILIFVIILTDYLQKLKSLLPQWRYLLFLAADAIILYNTDMH